MAFDPSAAGSEFTPPSPSATRRWLGRVFWTTLVGGGLAAGLTLGTIAAGYTAVCGNPCIDLETLRAYVPDQASVVYDRRGAEIGRFYVENRRLTPLAEVPPAVVDAFLAVEDARFYQHRGIDWVRVAGAVVRNLTERRVAEGFSTISMQLARNLYPDLLPAREKSLRRKLAEVRVAREIEAGLSKDEILERYLNTIFFGAGAYGIEAAARTYFNKPVRELTPAEGALLAGLPKAPSRYNPLIRPTAARQRRDVVLAVMEAHGFLSARAADSARRSPVVVHRGTASTGKTDARIAPYFLEELRKALTAKLGSDLYRRGYQIYTTLDLELQRLAEAALESRLDSLEQGHFGPYRHPRRDEVLVSEAVAETPYVQGAFVAIDPDSGDVLALIGGRAFDDSRFNRATQALRQPGSAFKPIVYATALAHGWDPEAEISDLPVTVTLPTGHVWSPVNFDSDDDRPATMTLRQAIALSRNRATVRLAQAVGLDSILATARAMGLPGPLPRVPSVVLGAAEVRPIDLVAAYTPVARNDGQRVVPRFVTAVTDARGDVVLGMPVKAQRSLDPTVAISLRSLLEGVVDRGTGATVRAAGYAGPAAGKTGTANGATDVWFVGATPDVVAGVWIGFDQPRAILRGRSATGGRLAGPIWGTVFAAYSATHPPTRSWMAPGRPVTTRIVTDSLAGADTTRLCLAPLTPGEPFTPDAPSRFVACATEDSTITPPPRGAFVAAPERLVPASTTGHPDAVDPAPMTADTPAGQSATAAGLRAPVPLDAATLEPTTPVGESRSATPRIGQAAPSSPRPRTLAP